PYTTLFRSTTSPPTSATNETPWGPHGIRCLRQSRGFHSSFSSTASVRGRSRAASATIARHARASDERASRTIPFRPSRVTKGNARATRLVMPFGELARTLGRGAHRVEERRPNTGALEHTHRRHGRPAGRRHFLPQLDGMLPRFPQHPSSPEQRLNGKLGCDLARQADA